jgi:hypothetical protein
VAPPGRPARSQAAGRRGANSASVSPPGRRQFSAAALARRLAHLPELRPAAASPSAPRSQVAAAGEDREDRLREEVRRRHGTLRAPACAASPMPRGLRGRPGIEELEVVRVVEGTTHLGREKDDLLADDVDSPDTLSATPHASLMPRNSKRERGLPMMTRLPRPPGSCRRSSSACRRTGHRPPRERCSWTAPCRCRWPTPRGLWASRGASSPARSCGPARRWPGPRARGSRRT